jgi:hypothetical protein
MKVRFDLVISFSLLLLITACKDKPLTPAIPMPDIGIPHEEMNTKIHLTAPDGWNTFKIGDEVSLSVEVISNDKISFPPDYGARMFILENSKWKEIPNFMKYPEGNLIISQTNGNYLNVGGAPVDPLIPDQTKPVLLRIILVGNIYRDGQVTAEKTAAYIDVKMTPK